MESAEQMSFCPSLSRLEKLVLEMEQLTPMVSSHLVEQLRDCFVKLPPKLSNEESLQAWRLSYSIWNSCVDIANNLQPGQEFDEDHAKLRQIASDLLFLAKDIDGVDSSHLKIAIFFYRTGVIWHKVKNFQMAAVCFEKSTELMSKIRDDQEQRALPRTKEEHEFMFNLVLARSETAWELSQKALACSLLGRARSLLVVLPDPEQHLELAEHLFRHGKCMLTEKETESQAESIKFLEQAYEICSSATNSDERDKHILGDLKLKILRYLAAGHLQMENYESVLKCLAVLKSAPEHPSTYYLAVKALAGLDRYDEAKKELFALLQQKDATVEACMSAIEIVLQSAEHLQAGKRAFLTLQSRHPSNKGLPVRILECLLRRLPTLHDMDKRVEAAVEIATNENSLAIVMGGDGSNPVLDIGTSSGKEQQCIHALLWNSGSEQFHAKHYETSIKLFETSMLYLSRQSDSNLQRAKSLRVLCLCRLALLQYDRAKEYVTEAEKINPNIACAFLKFKLHLQTSNAVEAAEQVERMPSCPDFEPEYLSLASHEAVACNCIGVAISALSRYLSLPREKRITGTKEVVLLRNIVNLALKDQHDRMEALKHLQKAQAHLADAGYESFFGTGNLGQQEANWFASTSWNQGLLAVKTEEWQLAADFFSCAAEFYSSLPENQHNLQCLQKCLLLGTSSLLASNSGESSNKSASRMLDKYRKVHRALAMNTDPTDTANERYELYLNLLTFDLKSRIRDHKSQLDILHHSNSLPGVTPNHFLTMASLSSKTAGTVNEVTSTAYRLALQLILSSPSPDYKLAASIFRKLIELADQHCKDGPEVMAVYKQAKEILAGLDNGDYPNEELQWLISTCWNRAGLQVKFLRFSEAEPWMEIALELANHAPQMESRKLSMTESLNKVRQNKQSQFVRD